MTRDEMLSAIDKDIEVGERPTRVDVPGMGTFYVLSPSVAEIEKQIAEEKTATNGEDRHPLAQGAARVLCDETGKRLYDSHNPEHIAKLARLRWGRMSVLTKHFQGGDETGN